MILTRLTVAKEAAKLAGSYLLSIPRTDRSFSSKGKSDVVTIYDKESERIIIDHIHSKLPSDDFLGEEEGLISHGGTGRWIIDPIDGTSNFVHAIPSYTISIGYEIEEGKPIIGVVYDPSLDELFWAAEGHGAFCNGSPIQCSKVTIPKNSLSVCPPPQRNPEDFETYLLLYRYICNHTEEIREFGSAALHLCYLASGRIEGMIELHVGYYDIAAGLVVLKEAGGSSSSLDGSKHPQQSIIATNGILHEWYKKAVDATIGSVLF